METGADFEKAADAAVNLGVSFSGAGNRARIFSSVLLPAPLRPISPTTSPSFTSKLTSFSAQM